MLKDILDCCCGSKMFWFDKGDKRVLFTDIRKERHVLCDKRKLEISPDILMDFRKMDFPNKHFKLIVFDPPHLMNLGKTSWMAKKYGTLSANWENDLTAGFNECWRVLEDYGVLIFKWNERDIKLKLIAPMFPDKPLFGHVTGNSGKTKWICFIKTPSSQAERLINEKGGV